MSQTMTQEQAIQELLRFLPKPLICNCGLREGETDHYGMTGRQHGGLRPQDILENEYLAAIRSAVSR